MGTLPHELHHAHKFLPCLSCSLHRPTGGLAGELGVRGQLGPNLPVAIRVQLSHHGYLNNPILARDLEDQLLFRAIPVQECRV